MRAPGDARVLDGPEGGRGFSISVMPPWEPGWAPVRSSAGAGEPAPGFPAARASDLQGRLRPVSVCACRIFQIRKVS